MTVGLLQYRSEDMETNEIISMCGKIFWDISFGRLHEIVFTEYHGNPLGIDQLTFNCAEHHAAIDCGRTCDITTNIKRPGGCVMVCSPTAIGKTIFESKEKAYEALTNQIQKKSNGKRNG